MAHIQKSDYTYHLPEARIAQYPLSQRDAAKLLHYRAGTISHHVFKDVASLLPENALIVYNDTRVIPARLIMHRETGARIEILLLLPSSPTEMHQAMTATETVSWSCMIGNKKKWKAEEVLRIDLTVAGNPVQLAATLEDREAQIVRFTWDSAETDFATLVEAAGKLPLPPYLNREAEAADATRYQTVYAENKGAVAAPTAGLHFTDEVLESLDKRGVQRAQVTLHVGAGTFQPVKTEDAEAHDMHVEQMVIRKAEVLRFRDHAGPIIGVGTTSMRVLESLYWFGVEALEADDLPANHAFHLDQKTPYQKRAAALPTQEQALTALVQHLDKHNLESVVAETGIYVLPGYPFQLVDGLFTNFHLPGTTLMFLVAAFVGEDWEKIYQSALDNEYRFLSYGDSSLLWR